MNIALWIVQGLLAAMFTMAGIMKSTQPKEKLAANMPWVNDYSATQVKLIGILELLGGLGTIIPWATGIAPILSPIAAAALGLTMVGAGIYHIGKGEYKETGFNAVLLLLCAFVAYGRFIA